MSEPFKFLDPNTMVRVLRKEIDVFQQILEQKNAIYAYSSVRPTRVYLGQDVIDMITIKYLDKKSVKIETPLKEVNAEGEYVVPKGCIGRVLGLDVYKVDNSPEHIFVA